MMMNQENISFLLFFYQAFSEDNMQIMITISHTQFVSF